MKMENRIIPTIFEHNREEFDDRFNRLIKISNRIQIDFMDGLFVKMGGIGLIDIPNLNRYKKIRFEAHLMCYHPEKMINGLRKKGFKKIIFHYEAMEDEDKVGRIIDEIKNLGMEAWIALNPETETGEILSFYKKLDGVMFMGHRPGIEHINFVESVYEKIERFRSVAKKTKIEVDGGVNLENIEKLAKIGVNYLSVGSLIENSADAKELKERMNKLFEKAFP